MSYAPAPGPPAERKRARSASEGASSRREAKGGDGNGRRPALLDAARVREDKAREVWHRGLGRGREKGKCVANGHLEREGARSHSSHACR